MAIYFSKYFAISRGFIFNKSCPLSRWKRNFSNARATQITELSNGLKVATEETNSSLACVSLFILTGPRFENVSNNGISHLIEHMAYKGFCSMTEQDIETKLNDIGAKMTVHTTREYQYFSGIVASENVKELTSFLIKIITDLEFPTQEVELEKNKIRAEMIDNDNNPESVLFDYLHQTAFQGTPLAQPVIASTETLKQFDSDMAASFMKENYIPSRMVLASSGGVFHSRLVSLAESCVCKSDKECSINKGPQRFTGSQIIYRDDSMPYVHVAIAVEAPGYNSPEYLPFFVASCLIDSWDRSQGGNNRHGSPLARASATSCLCEKFESFYITYQDVGLWGIYFVSKMIDADDMIHNIQEQWMYLCTSTLNSDLQRAVNVARMKLAKNVNGSIKSSYDIGRQVLFKSNRKSLDEIYYELSNITVRTLKDIGYKYIYDKCPAVAAVGPTEVVTDYNRIRSGMYWLRL